MTRRIASPARPFGLAYGAGSVWVAIGRQQRPRADQPADEPRREADLASASARTASRFGAGSVWTTSEADGTVRRINPATNRVVAKIKVGQTPNGILYAFGAIWVADSGGGTLSGSTPGRTASRSGSPSRRPTGSRRRPTRCGCQRGRPGRACRSGARRSSQGSASARTRSGPRGSAASCGCRTSTMARSRSSIRQRTRSGLLSRSASGPLSIASAGGNVWISNSNDGSSARGSAE